MSPQLQRIEKEALLLDPEDREILVESPIRSLQASADAAAIDPAWIAEAERRYQEVKSGQVQAISGDGLFDEIRQETTRLENDERFLARIEESRRQAREGRYTLLEDLPE